MLSRIINKGNLIYRRHILRDKSLLEFSRWFDDKGDQTLRLDYPLKPVSVVFDVGGYQGDFAADIFERYGCNVFLFEPVPEFYQQCVERFRGNGQIICLNYGLSLNDGWFDINFDKNSSSFTLYKNNSHLVRVRTRAIVQCIRELGVEHIDLMKINIEGGEFDVVPALIESGDISRVNYLQVQFHSFVERARERRSNIRQQLMNTHNEMWNYEFVWESWKLRNK